MTGEIISRILFLVFLVAIPVGAIFLQIYLSKKDSKLLGLILPIVALSISLLVVMGMAVFVQPGTITVTDLIDGELVTTVITEGSDREEIPGAIGAMIYTFVFMNIPTIILLIIYKAVRGSKNRNRAVEKMSLQDL